MRVLWQETNDLVKELNEYTESIKHKFKKQGDLWEQFTSEAKRTG